MRIIGIDLGTTNSCVYYLDDAGQPVLVMPQNRYKIFPSVVWSAGPGKEIVVGHAAKTRLGHNPPPVVTIKRKMGTTEAVRLGGKDATPVEISAHILSFAKALVEEASGDQVGGLVVTVPAYFDAAPKNDTYLAAVHAFFDGDEGLAKNRVELQLEPEAAAYAYASESGADWQRVLVYDLGGGTFDVTILERSAAAGLRSVKFGGDPHLGGDNIDDRVATGFLYLLRGGARAALDRVLDPSRYPPDRSYQLLSKLLRQRASDLAELRADLRPEDYDLLIRARPPYQLDLDESDLQDQLRIQILKRLAEQAKIDLTTSAESAIVRQGAFEDKAGETVDIDLSLSQLEFNRLINNFIARTIACTREVLDDACLDPAAFDRVLLVGGSSRMPIVREELAKLFLCEIVLADPDLIVAPGAALRARALNPPPLGVRADEADLVLEYPRVTAEETVTIRGRLRHACRGHAFLLHGDTEVDHVVVAEDRFQFQDVTLTPNGDNRFRVEVTDEQENPVSAAEVRITHDPAVGDSDRLAPKVTKEIRARGTRNFHTLFREGELLPVTRPFVCHRATEDDYICIEFYEGERLLAPLLIPGIDRSLPIGAPVDLEISVSATYAVSAVATVRDTRQSQAVEFQITRLIIPSLQQMDQDLKETRERIDNDLPLVRDPNRHSEFDTRALRLVADYRQARGALAPDRHKLYSTLGELRTLLIEIGAAQVVMEPELDETRRLCGECRRLGGQLPAGGPVRGQDVIARADVLERAAAEAWDREDAREYERVFQEVAGLYQDLKRRLEGGDGPKIPPAPVLQQLMLDWIRELRQDVSRYDVGTRLGADLDAIQEAVREVDVREERRAQQDLLSILHERLQPLAKRIGDAVKSKGGSTRTTTVDF